MAFESTRRKLMESGFLLGAGLFLPFDQRKFNRGSPGKRKQDGSPTNDRKPPTPYPANPFITTMGGEYSLAEEHVTSVLSLHPDVLCGAKHRNGPEFSLETGLPATRQMWLSSFFDEYHKSETEQLRKKNAWTYPDGSPVENSEGILAEKYDGAPHDDWDGDVIPSVFAPAMVDLIKAETNGYFEQGYTAIQFGNIRDTRLNGLDFSIWAQAAFRAYLNELPENRRDDLGVKDPDSFDIRDHLKAEGLTPGSSVHPADDPVFREFLLFHHKGVKALLSELHEWVGETFAQRPPPFYLDQPIGDPHLWECAVAETYASEHVDQVSTEDYRTMPAAEFGLGGNPDRAEPEKDIRDFVYKLMLATARNDKPVFVWDVFGGSYYSDISSGDYFPRLLRLQAAEAYAMGCQRRLTLRDAPLTWRSKNGPFPEVLREFVDFLWAHQRFLRDTEPANQVAVIWSLPTLLWNTVPQWYIKASDHTNAFLGSVTLLRESQIPYDVIVFGHPELWPAGENLDKLPDYDAVVLPQVESITANQLTALENVIAEGGRVITGGSPPHRTGSYELMEGGFDIFDRDPVVSLEPDPGVRRLEDGDAGGELIEALNRGGIESVLAGSDDTIGVNLLGQPTDGLYILHLLNYDYNPGTDEFNRKRNLEVQVDTTEAEIGAARYYSPHRITDVDFQQRNGGHVVTVPELSEWGFVVMAPSESRLRDSGSEQKARSRLSEATTKLRKARAARPDRPLKIVRAEVDLRSAETALEHHSFSLAVEKANTVIHLAEAAMASSTPTPEHSTGYPNATTAESDRTQSPGQPGFGSLTTIVGLGGAAYLLNRRSSHQKGDESKGK